MAARKRIFAGLLFCGLVGLAWTLFNPRAEAFIVNWKTTAVPLFGMPQGTVARLNVVNIGDPNVSPEPCTLELKFFSDRGSEIAQKRVALAPGQSDFLQIGDPNLLPGRLRAYRRAEIISADRPEPGEIPPGPCLGSLEVIENLTGRTMIFMGDGSVIPNP